MSKVSDVRWRRWAGVFAGVLVLFKSVAYVVTKLFRLGRDEVQARGGDVAFVLGLTQRRRSGRPGAT